MFLGLPVAPTQAKGKGTSRRDEYQDMEAKHRETWAKNKVFEMDPDSTKEKARTLLQFF